MNPEPQTERSERSAGYGRFTIAFHWTIALLILLNSALALFRETFAPQAVSMISAHKAIGLAVMVLSLAWLAWRRRAPRPGPIAGLRHWEARLAAAVHGLLLS